MRPLTLLCATLLFVYVPVEVEDDTHPSQDGEKLPFEYTVHPCFEGEEGQIEIELDTRQFSGFYAFLCHQENGSYVYDVCAYHPPTGGYSKVTLPIPASLTAKRDFSLEFGIQDHDPRDNLPASFLVRIEKDLSVGERYQGMRIGEETVLIPGRKTIVYNASNPDAEQVRSEHYAFTGFEATMPDRSRKFSLSALEVIYGGSEDKPHRSLETRQAELRLLNHIDEFEGLGEVVGNAYRSIPLRIYEKWTNNRETGFGFSLKDNFLYSKRDFTITSSTNNSFISNDLYVPLRQGHDSDAYRYQIFLNEVSPSKDSFILEGQTAYPYRFFGPLSGSDYSLVVGGYDDA